MRTRVRIKVCCIGGVREAQLAFDAGVDAVGLVSAMPSGPGQIGEDLIAEIAARTPPGVDSFLLTSLTDVAEIARQHARCRTSVIQVVDRLTSGGLGDLVDALPGVRVVQVIHVQDEGAIDESREAAEHAHALLLDSGRPGGAVKQLGGTGRTHDWALSRRIVDASPVPVYLAGGLSPDNVAAACAAARPFGVDVCSGVRTGGRLDGGKLAELVAQTPR
ncbi:MAG: phosphoribosylanthranilate isomerase [Planctomycetota bacterium]